MFICAFIILSSKCRHVAVYILWAHLYAIYIDLPNQRTNLDFNLKQKTKNVNESAVAKDKLVSFVNSFFLSHVHFCKPGQLILWSNGFRHLDRFTWFSQKDHHQEESWTQVVVNRSVAGVTMQTMNLHSKALMACGSIAMQGMRLQNQMETILLLVWKPKQSSQTDS